MNESNYEFVLKKDNCKVIIKCSLHNVYDITIEFNNLIEKYRIIEFIPNRFRIGRLVESGKNNYNVGIEFNIENEMYQMIWPDEVTYHEIVKLIPTMKKTMQIIETSMNEYVNGE